MKTTFIYILIDPLTNHVRYVGKANDPKERFKGHMKESLKKNKDDEIIQNHKINWINKLKIKNLSPVLEIVDEVLDSEWRFWETHYISLYKSWGFDLVNLTNGGDGFSDPTGEIGKRISKTLTGRKRKQSSTDKALNSRREYKKKTGSWSPKGTYEKVANTRKNNYNPDSWSKEVRAKQSKVCKQRFEEGKMSEAFYKTMTEGRKGKLNGVSRAVVQYDLQGNKIAEFESIKQAAESVGLTGDGQSSQLVGCCKGKNLSAKGFIWLYNESVTTPLDVIKKINERKEFVKQNMKNKQKLRWNNE